MESIKELESSFSLFDDIKFQVVGFLGATILQICDLSIFWKVKNYNESPLQAPYILAFWHSDQIMMSLAHNRNIRSPEDKNIVALISQHKDGRIATEIVRRLKVDAIRGSSSKGGSKAISAFKRSLNSGISMAITPDGPKGPINESKLGAVLLSSITGAPILPVAIVPTKCWSFNSWDKMFFPYPFSKVAFVIGKQISFKEKMNREDLDAGCKYLTKILNNLKKEGANLL